MLRKPVEDIIREEIETVRARRIILDQLEGGLLTGAELREKITTDIKAQMVAEGASKREIAKVKKGKPSPEGFSLALQKLNTKIHHTIKANECIAIEDSLWGLKAAKDSGMHIVAITNSYEPDQLSIAEKTVSHLNQLTIDNLHKLCT